MIDLETILRIEPYALAREEKDTLFEDALHTLTKYHYAHSPEYRRILDALGYDVQAKKTVSEIPFLPVRLFKFLDLLSVPKSDVVRTMTSSGTSGQGLSKIYLDKDTATNQTKVLSKIVTSVIGQKRMPMLIIDAEKTITDRKMFSARGAAILGFSIFSSTRTFALDDNMHLDIETVKAFFNEHAHENVLIFGFTSLIWEYLYEELHRTNLKLDLSNAILIHGGGWKKMVEKAVDNETFKSALKKATGLTRVYNYYGMIEQTGSIFLECEKGNLHASIFSDIIIRDKDFSVCGKNEAGMIEMVSFLPHSYPGHALLSEDVGEVLGEDDCSCGKLGKYFAVHGRIKKAELRGCSDTYDHV